MISVGIDVSEGISTVCIMKPGGEVLEAPFEILHNIENILLLVNLIKTYDDEARVILEDTGQLLYARILLILFQQFYLLSCTRIQTPSKGRASDGRDRSRSRQSSI